MSIKVVVVTLCSVFLLSSISVVAGQEGDFLGGTYVITPPEKPDSLFFCSEEVPIQQYDVWERLDRELMVNMYWQSNQLLYYKRAARWFPIIEPILAREGVPDDIKYLALIESSFLNLRSSAGAAGFWQFLKGTAREYGLEVNDAVDERLNVEKATVAACAYLKKAYTRFGSWALAAASYNTGLSNIAYHIRTQGEVSYYNMHLPDETLRYVFRILAEKLLFEEPTKYGFNIKKEDLYEPYSVQYIQIDTGISCLFEFAKTHGVFYRDFKQLNPWLIGRSLPNKSRKTYTIALPQPSSGISDFCERSEVYVLNKLLLDDIFPKKNLLLRPFESSFKCR